MREPKASAKDRIKVVPRPKLALYRCYACGHEFEAPPGPVIQRNAKGEDIGSCPECLHLYVKWLNVKEMIGVEHGDENFPAKDRSQ